MTTPEQLATWRQLADAATPGEWQVEHDVEWKATTHAIYGEKGGHIAMMEYATDDRQERANAAFIAASREAVPALLAEVERLQEAEQATNYAYSSDLMQMKERLAERDAEVERLQEKVKRFELYEGVVYSATIAFRRDGWQTSSLELSGDIESLFRKNAALKDEVERLQAELDASKNVTYQADVQVVTDADAIAAVIKQAKGKGQP